MVTLIKVIVESVRQAFQQLVGNKLRSCLSLLGITIGIFCIIGVQSAVDSLEDNVRGSFEKLGNDVLYVNRFEWGGSHENWWKYIRRPIMNYQDYEAVVRKVKNGDLYSYHADIGTRTVKYNARSVENVDLVGVSLEFSDLFNLVYEKGRYFSPAEYHSNAPKIIIGHQVAEELFGQLEPIGKKIKVQGKKFEIIGIIEKSGDDLVNILDFDDAVIISYGIAKTMVNLKARFYSPTISIKAKEGVNLESLKDEVTGVLRNARRLKPKEDNNFSINEMTMLTSILDSIFSVLGWAGFFIGIFAILVGMFSVANIMFVSVKERTSLIGIKKALGAKKYIILLEFLIESIILCILGGIMGLLAVHLIVGVLSSAIGFEMYLSMDNILVGMGLSIFVGIVSGVIPALQAANMDPVVAMRK